MFNSNYWLIYLLVKLDDIKIGITNAYGITILCIVASLVSWAILYALADAVTNTEQNPDKKQKALDKVFKKIRVFSTFCFIVWFSQLSMNTISMLVPSTRQIAVIIVGGGALNSATIKQIATLDPKLAAFIQKKSDKWLSTYKEIEQEVKQVTTETKETAADVLIEEIENHK